MVRSIASAFEIGGCDFMEKFDPDHLEPNAETFDAFLKRYEELYRTVGIKLNHLPDMDAFVAQYLA